MNDASQRDKTLALAGVYQAATLARQLARRGYADEGPLQASVRSILIIDAVNTPAVFGGIEGVRLGLLSMSNQSGSAGDLEVAGYVVGLCQLARRFYRSQELVTRMSEELSEIRKNISVRDDGGISSEVFGQFSELYKANLSHLKPRIIVQGEQSHLGSDHVVAQIRTSLLAGVRAGVLFMQLGGGRGQLLLRRWRFMQDATRLLAEIDARPGSETLH